MQTVHDGHHLSHSPVSCAELRRRVKNNTFVSFPCPESNTTIGSTGESQDRRFKDLQEPIHKLRDISYLFPM